MNHFRFWFVTLYLGLSVVFSVNIVWACMGKGADYRILGVAFLLCAVAGCASLIFHLFHWEDYEP